MKTVLITGASSGFGFVTTLLLARRGYTVYAGVRNVQKKESLELVEVAQKEKLAITLLKLDVTQQADVDLIPAEQIDVLINNAGLGFLGAAEEFTVEEIKQQFEINYFGAIRLIKAVLPHMRTKQSGLIINISSIAGLIALPLYGIYASSKFALEAYSESLRFELRPFKVKVALIEPGSFQTSFTKNNFFPEAQTKPDSPYKNLTVNFFARFKAMETIDAQSTLSKLLQPSRVAQRIVEVIESDNPKFHNIIGTDARFLLFLKSLPDWLKQTFLRRMYHW